MPARQLIEAQFADADRADPFARYISSGWLLPDDRIRWSRTLGDHDRLALHLGLRGEEHLKSIGGVKLWSDGEDRTITYYGSQHLTPRRLKLLKDLAIEHQAALQDEDHNVIEDHRVAGVAESRLGSELGQRLRALFRQNRVAKILIDSEARSGPFDGGCLIVAKALQHVLGEGDLVRLVRLSGLTDHYGLKTSQGILDANGVYTSGAEWAKKFSAYERLDHPVALASGHDPESEIPDDPRAVKALAQELMRGGLAESLLLEGSIRYGWVKGEHVVMAPFTDGEDNHHISQRNLLPDGDDEGWKRWRFNSNLDTVFWWEAPTKEEREAVRHDLAADGFYAHENVFVELHSSPKGHRERAAKERMRNFNLDDLEGSEDPVTARAGTDLLDVTHYQDSPTDYVSRWLARSGD